MRSTPIRRWRSRRSISGPREGPYEEVLLRRSSENLLLLLTPLVPLLGVVPAVGRWALPLVAPLTLYAAFAARVDRRDYLGAWQLGIAWAALLSLGVIAFVMLGPEWARHAILHGEAYREEMFGWIATGQAPENDWRAFLPQHALHLVAFLLLTWASGGYLGLVLGALLTAYMSYFVGAFAAASGQPLLGALAAWVPWSVLRVMAFVLLGALFSRPLRVRRPWPFERLEYRLMGLAATGLLADVLVKALFARPYGLFLREMMGLAGS